MLEQRNVLRCSRGTRSQGPVSETIQGPFLVADDENEQRGRKPAEARRGHVRLASYLVTVFCLITLNFFLPRAMPGDPISRLENLSPLTPGTGGDVRDALLHYYNLDDSLAVQYLHYLRGLAQGDLGTSIRYNAPALEVVAERLPWTLLLAGSALALSAAVALPAGIVSGWRRGRPVDRRLLTFFLALRAFPTYFLALLGLYVFAVKLRWVPIGGAITPFGAATGALAHLVDVIHHLLLPAAVLAVPFLAGQYLLMRAGMVSALGADYLLLGKAKGLGERGLKYRYAARNALLPVVSLTAVEVSFVVSVSIFVEQVFAYPGLGSLISESAVLRDYPTLQACFLVLTLAVVTANFLAEVALGWLDPRTTR